jgi:hypothetical protein
VKAEGQPLRYLMRAHAPPSLATPSLAPFHAHASPLPLIPLSSSSHSASPTRAQDAAERERREQLEVAEALRRIEEKQTQQGNNSQSTLRITFI